MLAVARQLDVEITRPIHRVPMDAQTSDLAQHAEVDGELLGSFRGTPWASRHGTRARRRERQQFQVVDPNGAPSASPRGDDDLDGGDVARLAATDGTPCERDLSLLRRDLAPLTGKFEITPVHPPDVLAARIDELELQVVHGSIGTHPERELVVRGQIQIDAPPGDCIAGVAMEIEIELHGAPAVTGALADRKRYAVGWMG